MKNSRKTAIMRCGDMRLKLRWAMDFDYLKNLSDEELEFLGDFCQYFYHGSPHRAGELKITPKMRTESYSLNNSRQRDALNQKGMVIGILDEHFDKPQKILDLIAENDTIQDEPHEKDIK